MSEHPKRSLGQNFLIDPNYQRKIIQALPLRDQIPIVEIGPGRGALTKHLVRLGYPLTLIEKDRKLADALRIEYADNPQVTVIETDVLNFSLTKKSLVVGNLPYNIASQILIHFLKKLTLVHHLCFMFQKEMALRLVAKPDTKDYSLISLWAQAYTHPKRLFDVPPSAFRPKPRVNSSIVAFIPRELPLIPPQLEQKFWLIIPRLFQMRRKKIKASLNIINKTQPQLFLTHLSPQMANQRIGELSIEQMVESL